MDSLLQPLLTFVLLYKYVGIFLVTFLAAFALPIPSGSVIIASAFFVTQGYLDLVPMLLAGILGNIAGDNLAFFLARRYGEPLLTKIGLGRFIRSNGYKNVEKKLLEYPITTVFTSRFAAAFTPIVNIMAGMGDMPYWKFFVVEIIGEILDVGSLTVYGYVFGSNWEYIQRIVDNVTLTVSIIIALALLLFWRHWSKKHKKTKT